MDIHFLPLAAFAPGSSAGTGRIGAEAHTHTLTLRLTEPSLASSHEPATSGTMIVEALPLRSGNLLRAAVLPAQGPVLTITF